MQSKTLWARVALWGLLGFPGLIAQTDVAIGQRLVTTSTTSSLGACVTTVSQPITPIPLGCPGNQVCSPTIPGGTPNCIPTLPQDSPSCSRVISTAIAACTAAAAAAESAAFSAQSISLQSATSVLNRLNRIRQIEQTSGGTAATPETGGAGGATSSLAGGQPTSLSGSGIGTGGGGGGGQAAGTGGGGGERAGTGGGRGTTERRARTTREARTAEGAATRGVQRPMATKERRYQPPTSLVVAGWVEGIADYERRGSSTPTALGVLDTGTRMQSGTVQGGLDFNWTRTNVPWLDQMVLGIVASRSSAKLDINYGASATLEGWGIGAYWMGVTGPWSLDAVTKLDYFNYTPTGGTPPVPGIPSDFFFTNHTTAANLNYRIPMGWTTSFIEPTVGVMYVRTDADLGILNRATGDLLRLQGGARLGSTWDWWNGVSVLGMVKLLAYSNVHVSGLAVVAPALGGFGPGLASSTDEGKLRGEVEGSLTFGLGAGYSLNAETAVRFGSEYFAAGGKLGLRKAFSADSVQAADNRVQPVVYKAAVAPAPWVFEIGARYVYSSAKNWYDLYNDPTPTQLNSRLTYDGLNAHSGEGFFESTARARSSSRATSAADRSGKAGFTTKTFRLPCRRTPRRSATRVAHSSTETLMSVIRSTTAAG